MKQFTVVYCEDATIRGRVNSRGCKDFVLSLRDAAMLGPDKLCVGINALFQARGGGLTNLTTLIEEWHEMGLLREHQFFFFCSKFTSNIIQYKDIHNSRIVILKTADYGMIGRVITEQILMPIVILRYQLDVLFCPGNIMPILCSVPTVTTFQNAAPFCGAVTPANIGLRTYVRLYIIGFFMRLTAIRSEKVIFISDYFLNLFRKRFNLSENKGVVIYRARDNF